MNRRDVLKTGLGGAGAAAIGGLAGRQPVFAQNTDPDVSGPVADPDARPEGNPGEEFTIGPDGSTFLIEPQVGPITIFVAREIITMNPSNPNATHVAVRDGRILGAGSLEEVAGWGDYTLDETFADKVLTPGLIEAHAHSVEGMMDSFPYVGYFDRPASDGGILQGIQSTDDLIDRLRELDAEMADPDSTLIGLGFDPIYFPGSRLSAADLDAVSLTRPIFLFHASTHAATVNTAMLTRHDITSQTEVTGVVKGADGNPTGELLEASGIMLAAGSVGAVFTAMNSEDTVWNFGALARNAGITTVTDISGSMLLDPGLLATWQRIVSDPAFPARVTVYNIAAAPGGNADWSVAATKLKDLQQIAASDKLHLPGVKFVIDGSIQGWTAALNWPGYYTGEDQGVLLAVPEQLIDWLRPFHLAGINIQIHCNGGAASDMVIDTIEQLVTEHAWLDHRHTLQHAQLTTSAQFRRMAKLGMCANLFANHIWYWGDQHYELTVGPERANSMEACATAKREGVRFSIHSDANVTPLGQLHTMWCVVNRITPSGRVLGEYEKISPYDALHAVTIGAAYTMHLDAEIGSIECGKFADFTVLDESPLDVEPMAIKDIPVWGTVVGGVKYEAPRA